MVDLSGIEMYIPHVAQMLGIEPATALLIVGVIVVASNLVGKFIPDDATGALAGIRRLAKFIGVSASNRISAGLTVNEIAKTTVPIIEHLGTVQDMAESKLDSIGEIVQAFPGINKSEPELPERGEDGKFKKKEK